MSNVFDIKTKKKKLSKEDLLQATNKLKKAWESNPPMSVSASLIETSNKKTFVTICYPEPETLYIPTEIWTYDHLSGLSKRRMKEYKFTHYDSNTLAEPIAIYLRTK